MRIYTDIVNGDELATDAHPMIENGPFFEINGQMITVGGKGISIGVADEGEEDDDNTEQKIDIVYTFGLVQTPFDEKSYWAHFKKYVQKVVDHLKRSNPDRVKGFMKEAQEQGKEIVANFKDYEFFTGQSMDPEAQVVLLKYREDGITPYFLYWKDGLQTLDV